MNDRLVLICLGVWFLLWGLFACTNLRVVWSDILMGIAALIIGGVCLFRAIRS